MSDLATTIGWISIGSATTALALAAILARNIVRRVFALGIMMILVSACLWELGAPMIAVIHLLLYAGGIVVLFAFALGRLGHGGEGGATTLAHPILGSVVAIAVVAAGWSLQPNASPAGGHPSVDVATATLVLARTTAFEGAGLVVLAATVAALAIIRGKK